MANKKQESQEPERRGRGRPPLPEGTARDIRKEIQFSPAEWKLIDNAAGKSGVPAAVFVREMAVAAAARFGK